MVEGKSGLGSDEPWVGLGFAFDAPCEGLALLGGASPMKRSDHTSMINLKLNAIFQPYSTGIVETSTLGGAGFRVRWAC